jgi:hypothetical protein
VSKDSLRLKPLWHRHRGSNPVISQPVLLMRLWKQWHSHPSRTLFGFRGESDISRIQFSPFVDLPALGSPWSHLSVFWNCTWPKPPETLLHETNRNLVTIIECVLNLTIRKLVLQPHYQGHLVGADVQRWRKEENEKRRCLEGIMTGTKEEGVRYFTSCSDLICNSYSQCVEERNRPVFKNFSSQGCESRNTILWSCQGRGWRFKCHSE